MFTADTFDYFSGALKIILTANLSAESLRALALYLTYAVHKTETKGFQGVRYTRGDKLRGEGPIRRTTMLDTSPSPIRHQACLGPRLSQSQVAFKVLNLYADLLCKVGDVTNIKKFARTVTNKVNNYPLYSKSNADY